MMVKMYDEADTHFGKQIGKCDGTNFGNFWIQKQANTKKGGALESKMHADKIFKKNQLQ